VNPEMLIFVEKGLVLVPYLRRLVLVIPLEPVVSGREISFFGPNPVFVPSYAQKMALNPYRVITCFRALVFSSVQHSSFIPFWVPFRHGAVPRFFDDQGEVPLLGQTIPELVHLGKFVPVSIWMTGNGIVPKKAFRINREASLNPFLPTKHRDVSKLLVGLPDDIDAFVFEHIVIIHS